MRITNPIDIRLRAGALLLALTCAGPARQVLAQGFTVAYGTTTTGPGGGALPNPVTVLTWPDAAQFAGSKNVRTYNLYRKVDLSAPYPVMPLNTTPIKLEIAPDKLRALLGSDGWRLIGKALAGRPPGDLSGMPRPFDPGTIGAISRGSKEWIKLQALARAKWWIAVAIGQGYVDTHTTSGVTYYYELRGLDSAGRELRLATDIVVTAGPPRPIPPPANLTATPGDSRVLLTWGERPEAGGFHVYRSEAGRPFLLINESGFTTKVRSTLDGDPSQPLVNGLLDITHWDKAGLPEAHQEAGVPINGPHNGVPYVYRVGALDLLGNPGPLSAPTPAVIPVDTTRPCAPNSITVTPNDAAGSVEIRWAAVTRDTDGHVEQQYSPVGAWLGDGVARYRVYRYASADEPAEVPTLVAEVPAAAMQHITTIDADPALRPAYGERTHWYRVESEDAARNRSARSAAVAGRLRDITPPLPPVNLTAVGLDDRILVTWNLSPEPDVDGYIILRSFCHTNRWPCRFETNRPSGDCENTWIQIGYLAQRDALRLVSLGQPLFQDTTVLPDSPCYAYLVKVEDRAQNKSGHWPPDPENYPEPYVCARLHDTTPPPPAVITKLEARDVAVKVSWVGAPMPDIGAYYVYRSSNEMGPYDFVGGLTVTNPPDQARVLTAPLPKPSTVGCDTIRLVPFREMSAGTFADTTVQPKKIYWYKVLGVDQAGNITETSNAVPVSTFTFTTAGPAPPVIASVTPNASPCQVVVAWTPVFDLSLHSGFMVLRDVTPTGSFLQVGTLVTSGNQYTDTQVQHGMTYRYQVIAVDTRGLPSAPSTTAECVVP